MQRSYLVPALTLICGLVFQQVVIAGGPLISGGANPVIWNTSSPIKYKIDKGKLGAISATDIDNAIKTAFTTWSNVSTASIKFQFDGILDQDVKTLADYVSATHHST